jgi:hypothetical protein
MSLSIARIAPSTASREVAARARVAVSVVAAVPADADALADLPWTDARAYRVDDAGDLVAGHDREAYARERAFLSEHIGMADAASLDPDADLRRPRFGNVALDQLEGTTRAGNLHNSHLCHVILHHNRQVREAVGQ